jgi:hypothetical protein
MDSISRTKFGNLLTTEAALAGLNIRQFAHMVLYDATPSQSALAVCAAVHASVTFFLQPHEFLAVKLLRSAGVPVAPKPAPLRGFHFDFESREHNAIEKVMRLEASFAVQWKGGGAAAA